MTDKETAILDAMLDLVAEYGFHGTAMSMVVKRSGVSTGNVYHYFEGKDDIIRRLYVRIKGVFGEALMVGNPQTMEWPEQLKKLWRNAFWFYVSHPRETSFLEQYQNSPYYNFSHDMALMAGDENMAALFRVIEMNVERGHIRPLPFDVMYELTLGVAVNLAKRQIAGSLELDEAMLEEVASACCRALEP